MRRTSLWACWGASFAFLMPAVSWATGLEDLEAGILAYENLNLERARQFLMQASSADDLVDGDRARARLYLGLLEFELGHKPQAEEAWNAAFILDLEIVVPEGTSPKMIDALEIVRARVRESLPRKSTIVVSPPPDLPKLPPSAGPPTVPPAAPPNAILSKPVSTEEDSGPSGWVWVGVTAGAMAVAAGIVAIVLVTQNQLECTEKGGGCILVGINGR